MPGASRSPSEARGTNDTGTAWTTYTPTITAGTGSFTTVSATGRYKTIGKTVFVEIKVTDTTNGTAASFVVATLPFSPAATNSYSITGQEGNGGFTANGSLSTNGGGTVNIFKYDGTFPLSTGDSLFVSGVYEST